MPSGYEGVETDYLLVDGAVVKMPTAKRTSTERTPDSIFCSFEKRLQ